MKRHLLILLTMLLPLVAKAYDAYIGGIFYNLSGNEATVTYEELYIYTTPDHGRRFYRARNNYKGDVVIPESVIYLGNRYHVTTIGDKAFEDTDVRSISIPKSVTSIASQVFFGCSVSAIYCYAPHPPEISSFSTASITGVVPTRDGKDASEIELFVLEDAVEQYRNHGSADFPGWQRLV